MIIIIYIYSIYIYVCVCVCVCVCNFAVNEILSAIRLTERFSRRKVLFRVRTIQSQRHSASAIFLNGGLRLARLIVSKYDILSGKITDVSDLARCGTRKMLRFSVVPSCFFCSISSKV